MRKQSLEEVVQRRTCTANGPRELWFRLSLVLAVDSEVSPQQQIVPNPIMTHLASAKACTHFVWLVLWNFKFLVFTFKKKILQKNFQSQTWDWFLWFICHCEKRLELKEKWLVCESSCSLLRDWRLLEQKNIFFPWGLGSRRIFHSAKLMKNFLYVGHLSSPGSSGGNIPHICRISGWSFPSRNTFSVCKFTCCLDLRWWFPQNYLGP